jgi:hypothetical protein
MITVLKFPVYVQIETDNIDRAIVSKASKDILYPKLLEYLASASYKKQVLEELSRGIGSPVSVSLLTEIDLISRSVSKEVPSTFKCEIRD